MSLGVMAASDPWNRPLTLPAAPPPAPAVDDKLTTLSAIFPDLDAEILSAVLSAHNGHVEAAVAALLEVGGEAPPEQDAGAAQREADEQVAKMVQMEVDGQVAAAIQEELKAEAKAEEERRKETSIEGRAMAVASKAQAEGKRLLQMAMRPLSARGAKKDGSHGTRLLDAASEVSDGPLHSPLHSPLYSPPPAQSALYTPPPPEPTPPFASPSSYPPFTASVSPPPTSLTTGAARSPEEKYASRVDRARAANRQASLSRAAGEASLGRPASLSSTRDAGVEPLPTMTATLVPREYVPEGDLLGDLPTTTATPAPPRAAEGELI